VPRQLRESTDRARRRSALDYGSRYDITVPHILALGERPSPRLRGRLAKAGIRLAARAAVRVYFGARPPVRVLQAPWLWAATGRPDRALAAAATLAGAYDVIAVDAAFPATLARRLAELATRI
jgi:hypothetical protein